MTRYFYFLFFITFSAFSQTYDCEQMATETFSDLGTIHGKNGGFGWAGAWEVQNGNPGPLVKTGNPLRYLTMVKDSNHIDFGKNYLRFGRNLDLDPQGPFANHLNAGNTIGKPNTQIYFSFLFKGQPNIATVADANLNLHNGNTAWFEGTTPLRFGKFPSVSLVNGVHVFTLTHQNQVINSTVPIDTNTHFIVIKMAWDVAGIASVSFAVDPSPIASNTDPVFSTPLVINSFSIKALSAKIDNPTAVALLDNLRFGINYKCVSPDSSLTFKPVGIKPVAVINALPTTGTAPTNLQLDASQSFDNDGTIVSYAWLRTAANVTDTISKTSSASVLLSRRGLNTITLVVKDNDNLKGISSHTITISNTAEPCDIEIAGIKMPNCSGLGGELRFYVQSSSLVYDLKNALGQSQPKTNGNFLNLSPGLYSLTGSQAGECSFSRNIYMLVDSNQCTSTLPNICNTQMGMNLSEITDYGVNMFKDVFKQARPEYLPVIATVNGITTQLVNQAMTSISLDTAGYITKVPVAYINNTPVKIRFVLSAASRMTPGSYVLKYEGNGDLTLTGATNWQLDQIQKRATFDIPVGSSVVYVNIDSSMFGNHLRNIRIFKLEDEFSTDTFDEAFINHAAQFSVLRTMNLQHTNASPLTQWSQRRKKSFFTQSDYNNLYIFKYGLAEEYIAELSNVLKKDLWLCVPHAADSNYVVEMAQFFKVNLLFNQNIYLEYSNEVWNFSPPFYVQSNYVNTTGKPFLSLPQKYADKATWVFKIWREQFGLDSLKVKRVIAGQTANVFNATQMAFYLKQNEYDYLSGSSYFGHRAGYKNKNTVAEIVAEARNEFLTRDGIDMKSLITAAKALGKELVFYEGGQHIVDTLSSHFNLNVDTQASQLLGDLYTEMLDSTLKWGAKVNVIYQLYGPWGFKFGSWGHLQKPTDNIDSSPKLKAVLQHTCRQEPCGKSLTNYQDLESKNTAVHSASKINLQAKVLNYTANTIISEKAVEMQAGFETKLGAVFKAAIGGCEN